MWGQIQSNNEQKNIMLKRASGEHIHIAFIGRGKAEFVKLEQRLQILKFPFQVTVTFHEFSPSLSQQIAWSSVDLLMIDYDATAKQLKHFLYDVRLLEAYLPIVLLTNIAEVRAASQLDSIRDDYENLEVYHSQTDETGQLLHYLVEHALEQEELLKRLNYLTGYDHLTGLVNRTVFRDKVVRLLARTHYTDHTVAVVYLGLDRFKAINDSFGHEVGDKLLGAVARRIREELRAQDSAASLGSDEFTLILDDMRSESECLARVRKILDAITESFVIKGHTVHMTASAGVSLFPSSGKSGDELIRNAHTAMYKAKEFGGDTFQVYTPEMNVEALSQLKMENHLRHAVGKGELQLYYQPQVNIHTNQVVGVEALLRWTNHELGSVSPAEFIPIAEETGLIIPIGEWIIEETCQQIKKWQELGIPPIRVSINISSRQFREKKLAQDIKRILDNTQIDPSMLALELTESLVMDDAVSSSTSLSLFREMGIQVHVDDFGTGYSSLSYLKLFPIDVLKIDRSFIRDISTDPNDAIISAAIIGLAHNLGMEVVAEGVETKEQLEFLREKNCDIVQGFYFAKPMPADGFVQWFNNADFSKDNAA